MLIQGGLEGLIGLVRLSLFFHSNIARHIKKSPEMENILLSLYAKFQLPWLSLCLFPPKIEIWFRKAKPAKQNKKLNQLNRTKPSG